MSKANPKWYAPAADFPPPDPAAARKPEIQCALMAAEQLVFELIAAHNEAGNATLEVVEDLIKRLKLIRTARMREAGRRTRDDAREGEKAL